MPRPQIVTWMERMHQAERCDFLLTSQKMSYKQVYQKSRSYLGLLACIILDFPNKMLSTSQLIDKMMAFVAADRKRIEKPVKTCLSSYKCFVKRPTDKGGSRRTHFWTLDKRRMTTNVKAHVKATLELFPGFASTVRLKLDNGREHCLLNRIQRNFIPTVAPQLSPEEFKLLLKRCSTTEWQIVALPTSTVPCNPALKPSVQYRVPIYPKMAVGPVGLPQLHPVCFEGFSLPTLQSSPFPGHWGDIVKILK